MQCKDKRNNMIKRIKSYFNVRRRNKYLEKNNIELLEKYVFFKEKSTPERVVEKVLKRGISWYDFAELDDNDRRNYANEATRLLQSEVLENEKNAVLKDLVEFIAKKSPDHKTTENLRMTINGIELLIERLGVISNNDREVTTDDIHDAV